MKGKETENSTFVYLSVLKERGTEGTVGGEGGGGGGGGVGGVLPHGIGLVYFRGKK